MKRQERQKQEWQRKRGRHANLAAPVVTHKEEDMEAELDRIEENPLILILDGVQDPHNLGACLRTADGAGVPIVIVPKNRAAGLTEAARIVASGAAENLFFVRVTNLARTIEMLQRRGIRVYGTADEVNETIYDVDLTGPLALVMGAEGQGVRRLTGDLCDRLVKVPMLGKVPCLNVSVATGVCLFEAVRQRHHSG